MLLTASRGAGPGPSTLAFRLSLGISAQGSNYLPRSPASARHYAAGIQKIKHKSVTFRPRPVTPYIRRPDPIPTVSTLLDPKEVIATLVRSINSNQNKETVLAWKRLCQLDAVGQLRHAQFELVSNYIGGTFTTSWADELFTQEQCTVLVDMAVQAAARDAWKGLYTLSITALRNNRPAIVANAYEKYKFAMLEVQGKTRSGQLVRDKDTRTGNRLKGFGPKPLTFVYLFAMMRLDQINGKVIMSVFETQRPILNHPQRIMDTVLASILPRLPATERAIVRKDFYKLIDTAIFILSIWHPQALLRTMRDLDFNQDWPALKKLYNRFLDLSVGPSKLIHAYDLAERDRYHYEEVPFTAAVWLRFIAYMKRSGDLAGLKDMLEVQMPLRGLKISPMVYRAFLIAFAYIARRPESPPVVKQQAVELAENTWARINRSDMPVDDHLLSGRIESLSMYDPVSVPALYNVISTGFYPQAKSKTLTCLVNYFMRQGHGDHALEIIRAGLEGRGICHPHKSVYTSVIKLAALSQYRGDESRRIVLEVLKLKPEHIFLDPAAVGLILAHMLSWGYTADQVVDRFRQSIMKSERHNTIDCWEIAITALLTRYQDRHESTESEFFVAIRLLGLTSTEPPPNITHYTGQLLWSKIFRRLIASSVSRETRADLLDLCIVSFPPANILQFVPDRFLAILEDALNRPRRDRISEAKGLVEWYLERSKIFISDLRSVAIGYVQLCVRYGEFGLALNMIEEQKLISQSGKRKARAIIDQVQRGKPVNGGLMDDLKMALVGQYKPTDDEAIVEPEPEVEEDRDERADDRLVAEKDDVELDEEDYA